ncbi:MAG: diphosphomevalonate decarboxylase [Flavobacteriaceae bacterium]|nr:diphosphomevalonate decarboxylase [Flavobacteriaceae bacterium]
MSAARDFLFDLSGISLPQSGNYTWKSPSNIALVKYWGKSEPQIPKNASVSFTLSQSHTVTRINFEKKALTEERRLQIFLDGALKESFRPKVAKFIERIKEYVPFLDFYHLGIHTHNSFPHSSGIASSASGLSALALCIMSLEKELNPKMGEVYFKRKASFLARLGSGSACRSIEGEIVVWGKHEAVQNSSDLFGIKLTSDIHPVFHQYQDTILLVDEGEKEVSSSLGHHLMVGHPFAEERFRQANDNLKKLLVVLKTGDLDEFNRIVEGEALSLHAMMMTSQPSFILMKPNTLRIIEKIREFRKNSNCKVCFTLDAGANVHVLYPKKELDPVKAFILSELLPLCQHNKFIQDASGPGASQFLEDYF